MTTHKCCSDDNPIIKKETNIVKLSCRFILCSVVVVVFFIVGYTNYFKTEGFGVWSYLIEVPRLKMQAFLGVGGIRRDSF